MPFLKRLGALLGKRRDEKRIGKGERHHEQSRGRRLASNDDPRVPKVGLSLARRMHQRHKHLGLRLLPLSDRVTNNATTAVVAMLIAQALKDPLGRVPLLLGHRSIGFENLMDDRHERIKLGPRTRRLGLKWSRLGLLKHFAQGLPMDGILTASLSLADLAGEHAATNLGPKFHVGEHSRLHR